MIEKIMNQVRNQAEHATGQITKTKYGIIDSYDPSTYSVKVKLQPDDTLTGWLPIKSVWIGNEWGMFCPPTIGDQVVIDFIEGDIDAGIVRLGSFTNDDRPITQPNGIPSGEFWLVHQSGSMLQFLNDGTVNLVSAANLNINAENVAITSTGLTHNGKNIGSTHAHGGGQTGGH